METVLISLSGGLDSAVLLGYLLKLGFKVECVSFQYGSKHNPIESACAANLCRHYDVPLYTVDISGVMLSPLFSSDLLITGGEIPEGHYEDINMKKTVVPARNMIFLSILAGIAESKKIPYIGIGVHQGDHFIYPDCRPEFINRMSSTIYSATDGAVRKIEAPLLNMSKAEIVMLGHRIGTPFELTRTCYTANEIACGKCGSCTERLEAFKINNLVDPIAYETGEYTGIN